VSRKLTTIPDDWPSPPFMMADVASLGSKHLLILGRTALAWVGVEYSPYDYVRDVIVHDRHTALEPGRGIRFSPWEHNTNSSTGKLRRWDDHIKALRALALRDGATPEAIRHLDGVSPFTSREVEDMASKLSKKTEAAPAAAAEKPAKAPKTPKADKAEGSGRKGNPEALAKARAARAEAGPDTRKLTILKKENPYREGSNRAASFDALKGAKTVEDYKTAGGKVKYITRWIEEELISVK
jgi:hypothetical protein